MDQKNPLNYTHALDINEVPIVALNTGTPNIKLSYAAENDPGAYFGFVPRVVPENVTLLPKTSQLSGEYTSGSGRPPD